MGPDLHKTPALALPTPPAPGAIPAAGQALAQQQVPVVLPAQQAQTGGSVQQQLPPAQSTADASSDNTTSLDEEWINKARAIVEQTKNDPYMESRELERAKADYLRIRYNKQLKIAEDQSK